MKWTERRKRFRDILFGNKCLHPASVFDPMSARIAEDLGFETGVLAGSVSSMAVLGAPDFNQEVRRCDFGGGHPDIQIIACTRNIQSGRFTGRNLAQAFTSRGLAHKKKGIGTGPSPTSMRPSV